MKPVWSGWNRFGLVETGMIRFWANCASSFICCLEAFLSSCVFAAKTKTIIWHNRLFPLFWLMALSRIKNVHLGQPWISQKTQKEVNGYIKELERTHFSKLTFFLIASAPFQWMVYKLVNKSIFKVGPRLWRSWHSGGFRHQRSAIWILTSAIKSSNVIMSIAIQKSQKIKKKRSGMAQ